MQTDRTIEALETHTAGMPTRVVTDGVPALADDADSVAEKRDALVARHDHLRKLLVMEPRGHDDMFCAVLTAPTRPDADLGAIFMNIAGCNEDMCIHGTIGLVTALIETGELSPEGPVRIETPAGLVTAQPAVDGGRVTSVTVESVRSSVLETGVPVRTPLSEGRQAVDLVYSGNTFALLDADAIGVEVSPDMVPTLVEGAERVLDTLSDRRDIDTGPAGEVNAVCFYQSFPDRDRTLVVAPGGHVDRSPSGTGTAARLVLCHHEGSLDIGEQRRTESVIGTRFEGRLRPSSSTGDSLVPEITGSAHLIARQTFLRDPADPIVGFSGLNDRFGDFELSLSERS